jgi:hypothetical protein
MKFPTDELMKMCQGESNLYDLKAVGGSDWVAHGFIEQRYIVFQHEENFYSLCVKRLVHGTHATYWIDGAELSDLIDCPEFKLFGDLESDDYARPKGNRMSEEQEKQYKRLFRKG